jgi:hypothetical protein
VNKLALPTGIDLNYRTLSEFQSWVCNNDIDLRGIVEAGVDRAHFSHEMILLFIISGYEKELGEMGVEVDKKALMETCRMKTELPGMIASYIIKAGHGLPNLTTVNGDLDCRRNTALTHLPPNLKTITGNLYIASSGLDYTKLNKQFGQKVFTYINNGNGTVTDTGTGLMWKSDPEPGKYAYDEAMAIKSDFAGHSDWRLPTKDELLSLVDNGAGSPTIDTNFFNCPPSYFWSASAYANGPNYAWNVSFHNGYAYSSNESYAFHARLVRGGQ